MNKLTNKKGFTLTHEFNAPKALVFNAFGNADALNEWWGPVETENSVISLDFKQGGIFHYKMSFNGNATYARFLFGQIKPHDVLEFTNAFTDEQANVIPAPFDMELPLEIFYSLHFTESNGKTIIMLTAEPVNATKEQEEGFHSINESMQQGFGATFNALAAYLENIKNR